MGSFPIIKRVVSLLLARKMPSLVRRNDGSQFIVNWRTFPALQWQNYSSDVRAAISIVGQKSLVKDA